MPFIIFTTVMKSLVSSKDVSLKLQELTGTTRLMNS